MATAAIPFSIDWILNKEKKYKRVDRIKKTFHAYDTSARSLMTQQSSYYNELSMIKYKLGKCYGIRLNSSTEYHESKPPSPVSYCNCRQMSIGEDYSTESKSPFCEQASYDDVFVDDRVTMTSLSPKSKGKYTYPFLAFQLYLVNLLPPYFLLYIFYILSKLFFYFL